MFISKNRKHLSWIGMIGLGLLIVLGLINNYVFDFTEIYLLIVSVLLAIFLLLVGLNVIGNG